MSRPITKLGEIERVAIRLFSSRGLGRVTTKEISQEAGCAEGTLYRHYSGMEDLAWSLFKREVEKFGRSLKTILESAESYTNRIKQSVSLFYRFFDEDSVTFIFILLSEHQFPLQRKINPQFNPTNLVFSFVRKGVKDKVFRIASEDLGAAMILGLVLTPATLCASGKLAGPMARRIADTTQACLKVLNVKETKDRRNAQE